MSDIIFVLGGARSGKSKFAESLTEPFLHRRTYLATAQALDEEMRYRIERHRQTRPADWRLIEEPLNLADRLRAEDKSNHIILVECLTLWLTNLLSIPERSLREEQEKLLVALSGTKSRLILVSNEVGLGITPINEMARKFQDEAGWLHQDIARMAKDVFFVAAGLPLRLK